MNHSADIVEIFSSLQGEGPYTGTPMTFVRFEQCSLSCKWCDTPQAFLHHEMCRAETPPNSGSFAEIANPISITRLDEILSSFENDFISITGGEPLLHAAFLAEWLPTLAYSRRILLETNGVHAAALETVIKHVHTISMDLKLPSSTGIKPLWAEHSAFLKTALRGHKDIYVKIVVTEMTSDHDLQEAIRLIAQTNKYLPIVLQPASPTLTFHETITEGRLHSVSRIFSAYLPNVSIAPQMHKQWGLL